MADLDRPTIPPTDIEVIAPPANESAVPPGSVSMDLGPLVPRAPAPPANTPPPMTESLGMPAGMNPAVADTVHHGMLGRAVHALMGNPVQYQVNPNTGATEAVPGESKPGDLWRHIVAGAILGGAVGSAAENKTPLQRAFLGAQGVASQAKSEDREAFNRAQESGKMQLETKRVNQELLYQQAQIAHMHQEDLRADAQFDIMSPPHLESTNQFNTTLENGAKEAGGREVPVVVNGTNINGKVDNGREIAAAYVKDPSILHDPVDAQGNPIAHRIHVQHVDTSGLHYEMAKGWVDDKGLNVDMATRTTHSFYDVPVDTFKQRVPISNKDLRKMNPGFESMFPNDDGTRMVPLGDLITMKSKAAQETLEAARAQAEITRGANEARRLNAELGRIATAEKRENRQEDQQTFQNLQILNERLINQKKELDTNALTDPDAAKLSKALQPVIEENNRQMQAFIQKNSKIPAPVAPAAGGGAAGPPAVSPAVKTVADGWKTRGFAPKSYADVDRQNLSADQKIDLAALTGVKVPYSEIQKLAQAHNANPEDAARRIEVDHPGIIDYASSAREYGEEAVAP